MVLERGFRIPSRSLRLFGLLCLVSGCAHWEPDTRPVPEVVAENPDKIMITRRDHSTVIVVEPSITDSLVSGLRGTPRGRVDRDSTVTVPLADVALLFAISGADTW